MSVHIESLRSEHGQNLLRERLLTEFTKHIARHGISFQRIVCDVHIDFDSRRMRHLFCSSVRVDGEYYEYTHAINQEHFDDMMIGGDDFIEDILRISSLSLAHIVSEHVRQPVQFEFDSTEAPVTGVRDHRTGSVHKLGRAEVYFGKNSKLSVLPEKLERVIRIRTK